MKKGTMPKIKRVRTGCWTCKKRRRKCDEAKPACDNCTNTGRECEGYEMKLSFDVDDSRNKTNGLSINLKGEMIHGFRGRPRLKESLAKRKEIKIPNTSQLQVIKPEDPIDELLVQDSEEEVKDAPPARSSLARGISEEIEIGKMSENESIEASKELSGSRLRGFIQEFHVFHDFFPSLIGQIEMKPCLNGIQDPTKKSGSQTPIIDNDNPTTLDALDMALEDENPISDFEENMMLKHFFKKLLPLFDAHPSSPWPQLALKYCDFEVSKSCFIALSCIHLYEQKGAKHFYQNGLVHINNTMEYLIEYLKDKSDIIGGDGTCILDVGAIIKNLKKQSIEKQRSNFFVILLLIHVHSLFSVVESGRSALVRTLFEFFAAIVKDSSFGNYLGMIDESSILVANLSWFDTISAVVSPDCRLPYCEETWYGTKDSPSSTTKLMGCPGEIFMCISRFCGVRKKLKDSSSSPDNSMDLKGLSTTFESIRTDLLNYRDYVVLSCDISEEEYQTRLKCAQCWALAVLVNLYRLLNPDAHSTINGFVNEFIATYNSMERASPLVTQMVWPIFTIGCVGETVYQRRNFKQFVHDLYKKTRMGTIQTIGLIMQECWETGKTWEEILASKEWLESGIDFLVV